MSTREYDTGEKVTWCPGCGNFAIFNAVKMALQQLGLPREQALIVSGIGCHGKMTDLVNVNGLHVIHGRVLPTATAVKLANHSLSVIGHAGDGDAFGIGLGHFAHAARRNVPISYVIHDNLVYGLTTGQTSPTSERGFKTKTSPRGVLDYPINPIVQGIAANASFIARGFAGEMNHLVELFKSAFTWDGFALVDVLQPCVTFNKVNTYDYYRAKVYKLDEENHDTSSAEAAFKKAWEWGDRIPIGIFYKNKRQTYIENFPALKGDPLTQRELTPNISKLVDEFR
jgi:2-oxoglutarate/2-oxoacid ferredoxin oxidoreductase subunit beta